MMKKIMLIAAVAVSLVLSGCWKENEDYKKQQPVLPGINIYQGAMNQNLYAMEQSNIGMRLAMLVAEAKKQGVEKLEEVTFEKQLVKNILLGASSKIEQTTTGYKITFTPASMIDFDSYVREGVVEIRTNGHETLEETSGGSAWTVLYPGVMKLRPYNSSNESSTLSQLAGASTDIYNNGNGTYSISLGGQQMYYGNADELTSNWSGHYRMTPVNMNLAYSDCAGKSFLLSGSAGGKSFNSYDGISATVMNLEMKDCDFRNVSLIRGGSVEATLIDGYNSSLYPSLSAEVMWTLSEDGKKLTQTILYNFHEYTVVQKL